MAEPYESYLAAVSAVDLDFTRLLPFNCLSDERFDHMDSLVTVTLFPLALPALGLGAVRFLRRASMATFKSHFIQLMLLVYPAISRQICQSFRCDEFDDGGADAADCFR